MMTSHLCAASVLRTKPVACGYQLYESPLPSLLASNSASLFSKPSPRSVENGILCGSAQTLSTLASISSNDDCGRSKYARIITVAEPEERKYRKTLHASLNSESLPLEKINFFGFVLPSMQFMIVYRIKFNHPSSEHAGLAFAPRRKLAWQAYAATKRVVRSDPLPQVAAPCRKG